MEEIIDSAKKFYINELNDFIIYSEIANLVKDNNLKESIIKIAQTEKKHMEFWKNILESRGYKVSQENINRKKLILLKMLSKFFNPIVLISILETGENSAVKSYYQFYKNKNLTDEEREYVKKIIIDEMEHETFFHKEGEKLGLSNVRDLILGMNDGLVEILGTVAGLTGVYANNPKIIGISGLVVGIAGALSMGLGAYISVKSQRQVDEAINERNRILLDISNEKMYELFEDKLKEEDIPENIISDIISILKEKKINISNIFIKENNENEIKSGIFTGFSYFLGVFFPVVPFFIFNSAYIALPLSFLFAFLMLSIIGVFVAFFSGISVKKKVLEMVLTGFLAAVLSFSFGKIVQIIFGIEI